MKASDQGPILVVAAHPDDEVLGCGGTVGAATSRGAEAHLLILANGIAARYEDVKAHAEEINAAQAALREDAAKAAKILGFASHAILDFPDNRLDTVARMGLAHAIDGVIEKIRPGTIYTHHPGDYNWDHTACFDAVMMAARPSPGEHAPARLLTFEVLSSTERAWQNAADAFHPNVYVDIARGIDKKKLAMKTYRSEHRDYPHPRSLEGIEYLARKRGLEIGVEYAEAFHLVREIAKA
ncbi:MAG: PIG-L family deacetylase [Deltaproteobacteria bacterium]|nr:PIG-L family deacetylase [Deltaproteobacteria bacterium]